MNQCLSSTPILMLLDLKYPFEIDTNTLECDISIVLTQHGHIIAYHNETLYEIAHKYPHMKRKCI